MALTTAHEASPDTVPPAAASFFFRSSTAEAQGLEEDEVSAALVAVGVVAGTVMATAARVVVLISYVVVGWFVISHS